MKTFKQFLAEQNSDTFVYCFGRYSPTTRGHIAHFQAIKKFAEQNGFPYMVYTSKTVDNKKNPVPVDAKIAYIKKAIPDLNITSAVNMFKLLEELIPQGYKRIIYFAGGDYFEEGSEENRMFGRLVSLAAEQGVELTAMSSGDRTPGISGSDLRKAVISGDFATFAKASPLGIGNITENDVRQMFNYVRSVLTGGPVSEGLLDFLMPKEDRLYNQMTTLVKEIESVEKANRREYLRNRSKQGWVPKNTDALTGLKIKMKTAFTMKNFNALEQLIAQTRRLLELKKTPSM